MRYFLPDSQDLVDPSFDFETERRSATRLRHRDDAYAHELFSERMLDVTRIVEKPAPEDAPSRLGVAGRYILTPGVMREIANQQRGVGGEIQLTDGMKKLAEKQGFYGVRFEGKTYDTGSKVGFLAANVAFAMSRPDIRPGFVEELKKIVGSL